MAKKIIKINKGTVCSALESEIKGNEMCKDCNTLIGSIRAEVRDVFFY
jgi:DNA-binding XRE family transcriptional regulator